MGAMDAMVQWKQERNGWLERSDARMQWCNAGATMQWEKWCCNGCSATRRCYTNMYKNSNCRNICKTGRPRVEGGLWVDPRQKDR